MAQTLLHFHRMDTKTTNFPQIRLVAGGCSTLVLLAWLAVFDDSWNDIFSGMGLYHKPHGDPIGILVTAGISLFILVVIFPVMLRGRGLDRWSAVILAIFPLFMFLISAIRVL